MAKKNKTPFAIFTETIGLYCSNITKFIKYMTFPVFGQVIGLILVFCTAYFYALNIPKLIEKYPNLDNFWILIGLSILISLPGLAILCKALWDYLVAYGAINSMLDNLIKSGRVYDFDAHTELINRRKFAYIGLWFLVGIFTLIAVFPPCWLFCGILAVYLILVFQVFTFEPELSPLGCARKSLCLIKGHFGSTFLLLSLMGGFTYLVIPQIVLLAFENIGLTSGLTKTILPFVSLIQLPDFLLNFTGLNLFNHEMISKSVVELIIAQIFIMYTLPLRSIMWSLWYKELNDGLPVLKDLNENSSKKKRSSKRPSEKLMENSHKKYSKKKLDDNIIKRAMEKDDGEE